MPSKNAWRVTDVVMRENYSRIQIFQTKINYSKFMYNETKHKL